MIPYLSDYRGTLDMKGHLFGQLEAVEVLLKVIDSIRWTT